MSINNHILLIPSWYPTRNNPTHGIFNTVFAQAAALHNKVSVLYVCSDDSITTDFEIVESTENNIHTCIVYYKKVKSRLPVVSHILKRTKLISGFEIGYQRIVSATGKPGLIQLNVAMPAGIGVMYLSKKYNLPYVLNEGWSGYYPEDGNYKGAFLKYFTKKVIAGAHVIMPVSESLKSAMLNHGLKGKYVVVPNAVNEELFKPLPHEPHTVTKFLHISSLNETEKNVSGIIRAFSEAYKINPGIELNIVGDGEEIAGLRSLASGLKIQGAVNFKGRVMGKELVREINENDALIMFSNYETFGITIIEALACGKPVVTAFSGGVANLITSQLGFVVERKDEASLKEKILLMASQKVTFNPEILRKFVTENFTLTRVGSQLNEIYNSSLA